MGSNNWKSGFRCAGTNKRREVRFDQADDSLTKFVEIHREATIGFDTNGLNDIVCQHSSGQYCALPRAARNRGLMQKIVATDVPELVSDSSACYNREDRSKLVHELGIQILIRAQPNLLTQVALGQRERNHEHNQSGVSIRIELGEYFGVSRPEVCEVASHCALPPNDSVNAAPAENC
jgi:hypothetical protein